MLPEKMSFNDFIYFLAENNFLDTTLVERYDNSSSPELCIKQRKGDTYLNSIMSEMVDLNKYEYSEDIDNILEKLNLDMTFFQYKRLMKNKKATNIHYMDDPYDENGANYSEEYLLVSDLYNFLVENNILENSKKDLYKQKDGLTLNVFVDVIKEVSEETQNFSVVEDSGQLTITQSDKFYQSYKSNELFFNKLLERGINFPKLDYNEYPGLIYFNGPSFSFAGHNWTDGMHPMDYPLNNTYVADTKVLYAFCLKSCKIPFPTLEPNDKELKKKISPEI